MKPAPIPYTLFVFLLCCIAHFSVAQTIFGTWKSIDDKTGEPKSIVEIYQRGAKVYGKIIHVYPRQGITDPVCTKCPKDDPRFGKKIVGMEIIKDLEFSEHELTGGEILDPEVGKVYRCKLWLENKYLKVRGYLGPFYRTQTWEKVRQ